MPLLILLLLIVLMGTGDSLCRLQGLAQPPELAKDGDLVIGGIFSFRTVQDYVTNTFQMIPELRKCYMYVLSVLDILNKLCVCVFCTVIIDTIT